MKKEVKKQIIENGIDLVTPRTERFLKKIFNEGKKLENTKAFSGPALENWTEYCWKNCFSFVEKELNKMGIYFSYRVDKEYINYDEDYIEELKKYWVREYKKSEIDFIKEIKFLKERLDLHVYINEKIISIEEDRAWVDKPFFFLKDRIIMNFLNCCKEKISNKMRIFLVSFSFDVPEIYCCLCNFNGKEIYGSKWKKTEIFNLTKKKRDTSKGNYNYFKYGFCNEEIKKYIKSILEVIIDNV